MLLRRRGVDVGEGARSWLWASFLLSWGMVALALQGDASRGSYAPVDVTSRHYPDMLHGFIGMGGVCPRARANVDEMIVELGTLVASAGESADGPGQR